MTSPGNEDPWNPTQYDRFQDERRRPFFDLAALVRPTPRMRIVDLGCGTGELTRMLHERFGASETLGVDSSDAMLARCETQRGKGLRFEKGDIAARASAWGSSAHEARFDLVFSNAAIHWVAGHEALLESLTRTLAPGGQLAVQVPASHTHPSHVVAREVAREAPFANALDGFLQYDPVPAPEQYATWLNRLGYVEQHVRLQIYPHRLASREGVLEWVKGTLLTDYERRLGPLFPQFYERYRDRLLARLEDIQPYFYAFPRILFWGLRA